MDFIGQRVALLAREHKLTPRETEVFGLLAHGRSIPYVRDALIISRDTAATHAKHIYAKLDVHSRQELIDRVWPKDVLVLDRTVDVNITRLRKKIGRFAKCIVTRLGFGYYFDA